MADQLPERTWLAVYGWDTAHLLAPAGNGWKSECGRHTTQQPHQPPEGMRHCERCEKPSGDRHQRPLHYGRTLRGRGDR